MEIKDMIVTPMGYIETMLIHCGVLLKGDFTLKDGSRSPYFFDLGRVNKGADIYFLMTCLDREVQKREIDFNLIVGPPYKGIALAAGMSFATGKPFDYYRKESKDHGEGGNWVTKALKPKMKVLIVDDVIIGGTAKQEAMDMVAAAGAEVAGIAVILDRNKLGADQGDSLISYQGIPVISLVTMKEVLDKYQEIRDSKDPIEEECL